MYLLYHVCKECICWSNQWHFLLIHIVEFFNNTNSQNSRSSSKSSLPRRTWYKEFQGFRQNIKEKIRREDSLSGIKNWKLLNRKYFVQHWQFSAKLKSLLLYCRHVEFCLFSFWNKFQRRTAADSGNVWEIQYSIYIKVKPAYVVTYKKIWYEFNPF